MVLTLLLVPPLPAAAQTEGRVLQNFSSGSSAIGTAAGDFQGSSADEGTNVSQGKRGCVSNCNAQSLATGGGEYGFGAFYSFKYDPKIIIHPKDFFDGANGSNPTGDLVKDSKAKLGAWSYGAAQGGGDAGCGTVFEAGSEAVNSIYNFQGGTADGCGPTGLIADITGNLFGTTQNGGATGHGAAFELSPNKDGTWTENLIYSFCTQMNCSDGDEPVASLVIDKEGNLFGTTSLGGSSPTNGTIFELSPNGNGGYNETVLYNFVGGSTGGQPGTALTPSNPNFYGTTEQGGIVECDSGNGCGVVYELSSNKSGGWTYTVIHSFSGSDGAFPEAKLISDDAGNFFGTTSQGGIAGNCEGMSSKVGCGTVFELSSQGVFSTLYLFQGGADGAGPEATLAIDASGDLYGTTFYGGGAGCKKLGGCGTIFELISQGGGVWTESVLKRFVGSNGASPASGLILSK